MTPADTDFFAVPDPDSLIELPWKPEVGWLAADAWIGGPAGRSCAAQCAETPGLGGRGARSRDENRRRMRVLPDLAGRRGDRRLSRPSGQAVLRPAGADAALRRDRGNLRCHAGAGLAALPERP